MSRSLLTVAFALFAAAPARADMGPFIPAAKHAEMTISRIEIADPLPGYVGVFVKSYGPPKPATEAEFVLLEPGTVLEFAGRYHDRAELLLVPRAAAEPYPTASALAEAVSAHKVRAVSRDFYSRETLPAWGATRRHPELPRSLEHRRAGDHPHELEPALAVVRRGARVHTRGAARGALECAGRSPARAPGESGGERGQGATAASTRSAAEQCGPRLVPCGAG